MGVNKVTLNTPEGEQVIMDTSGVSVAPETLFVGETALDKTGEMIEGSFTLIAELSQQDALISQIQTALEGKAAGSGGDEYITVTINHYGDSYSKIGYVDENKQLAYISVGQSITVKTFRGLVWGSFYLNLSSSGAIINVLAGNNSVLLLTEGAVVTATSSESG